MTDQRLLALINGALCAITRATSRQQIRQALQEFVVGCGYESYALARDIHLTTWVGEPELYTWPDILIDGYIQFETVRFDAGIAAIRRGEPHCHWTRKHVFTDKRAEPISRVLHDVGLEGGFMVSLSAGVSRCGVLSLSAGRKEVASPELITATRLIGDVALVRLTALSAHGLPPSEARMLSDRQLEILAWVARGKSNRDIAAIMGVTERSVTYHMSEVLRRLGVSSRAQAAAWLMGSGRALTQHARVDCQV